MDKELEKASAAACDLRLALEGLYNIERGLLDGLLSDEADALESICQIHVLAMATKSCMDNAAIIDEVLANL